MASSPPINGGALRRFARLIPGSKAAEEALDILCNNSEVTEYHRSFLQVKRSQKNIEESSDSEESSKTPSQQIEFWSGYYSLALNDASQKVGLAPWRIGKGTSKYNEEDRGVDLLLIGPGNRKHKVTDVHAMIRFHLKSGVLMLVGMHDSKQSNKKSIRYEDPTGNGEIELGHNMQHVLFLRRNAFWIGDLYYIFEFENLDDDQCRVYRAYRDGIYRAAQLQVPHPGLSAIPQAADKKFGPFVRMGSMSRGAFGWVYAGVHARTGDPVAIKEQSAATRADSERVAGEIDIGWRFSKATGILSTLDAFCEHRELKFQSNGICGESSHKIYSSSPLAIGDFRTLLNGPLITPSQLIEFYRGPLLGLQALHADGYMHRDISCGNLLVLSRVPAQAVLHDFGKAIKAPQDHRTNLGPMFTLAPEVDGMTRYNNKIDIWSLAFSFCQIAFPRLLEGLHPHLRTTPAWLDQTLRHLKNFRDSNPSKEAAPIDLIIGMLARDPDLRLSATQALKHRCFASDSETSDQLLPRKASRLEPATTRSDRPDAAPRSSPAGSARAAGPTLRQEIHDTSTKHSPSRTHYGPASPVEQEAHGLPGRLLSNSGRIPQPMTLNDRSNPSSRHQLPIDGRSPGPSPSQNPSDTAQRDRTPPRSPPNLCHVSQQTHDDNLSSDLAPTERFNQPPISSSEDSAPWIPEAERRRRSAATHADPWAYRIPKHQR